MQALGLAIAFVLLQVAMAVTVQHTVDWDFAPYPSYYSDWAAAKKFVSGERLSKNTTSLRIRHWSIPAFLKYYVTVSLQKISLSINFTKLRHSVLQL